SWRDFDLGERIVARYLWVNKIMSVDWMVLSHPDRDHYGGLQFIAHNFHPREFWRIAAENHDESYERLLDAIEELNVPSRMIDSNTQPSVEQGVMVSALNPPSSGIGKRNNASMVLRMQYGARSFLFTGDLEAPGEDAVLRDGATVASTVLKVPHHGSR